MKGSVPKGELVLLCSSGYFVENILYSNIQFDPREILHKSLISLADVQSFDAVLQLVSDIKANGSSSDRVIQIVLSQGTFNFTFSGTSLHEHVVLTASIDGAEIEFMPNTINLTKNRFAQLCKPGKIATEDLFLIEEINRLKAN